MPHREEHRDYVRFFAKHDGQCRSTSNGNTMPVDLDCTQLNAGIDPAVFAMTIAPGSVACESEPQTSFVPGGDAKDYAAAAEFATERLDAARGAGATSLKR